MQRKLRRASRPFAFKALTALTVAAAFSNASAAGLGKLTVLSALGQPLRAEIELTSVSKDEAESLVAKLASTQAFKQAKVDYSPALMSLKFAVDQRGARQFIRVSSTQPMNEPYVGMLIELSSSKGRLLREYTFLLDPPELRQIQTASIGSAPVVSELPPVAQQAAPAEKQDSEKAKVSRKTRKTDASTQDVEGKEDGAGEYRVRKGDTLGLIAVRNKHDGVSLDQMLVSIYRANPDAFIGNNMNRLKSGKVMTIPDAATAGSVSQSEARKVVVAQSGDFDQYRHKLAEAVAQAPTQQAEQSSQAAGGKITAKVEEKPSAVSKSVDRLKLAKESAAASDKPAAVVSTEDKLSQDKSVADAQARVRELEKNIKDLQGLLELKSKDLAVQQKQADTATAAKPAAAQAPAATPPVAAQQPKPAAKPKAVTPPPPPPQSSFFDDLLDNQTVLGGIAAAVLGIAYLIWNKIRRKKQADEMANKFLAEHPIAESPNSLFGTTGGQSVNTNNSVFNSSFSPSAMQVDANEVDPVAEADVYIAYGREAQAIEILKDALRAQPERNAVRIKLLEIYASQNDVLSFDALASDLYALTKGEGEDWAYAAKMGASIDPKNPLYTDSDVLEEIADKPVSMHAFTNPVEALDPDSLSAPSRLAQTGLAPELIGKAAEAEAVAAAEADDADLPLDIGSAESWANTRPATAEEQQSKSELEDMLDWPLETDKQEDMLQELQASMAEATQPRVAPTASPDEPLEFESMTKFPQLEDLTEEVAEPSINAKSELEEVAFVVEEMEDPAEMALQTDAAGGDIFAASSLNASSPGLQAESQPVAVAESAAEGAPLEFDFASINLDLGTSDPADNKPSSYGESTVNIEMATKLDLAVAYMEIGDKEGARELLDEVIKGGSDEQVAKAQETLARLK